MSDSHLPQRGVQGLFNPTLAGAAGRNRICRRDSWGEVQTFQRADGGHCGYAINLAPSVWFCAFVLDVKRGLMLPSLARRDACLVLPWKIALVGAFE